MFEVGKKVVCIDDSCPEGYDKPKIKNGQIYHLYNIEVNDCCGSLSLDVGIKIDTECDFFCNCGKFSSVALPGQIEWYNAKRFRPIDYDFADQLLEQIFEQELILP